MTTYNALSGGIDAAVAIATFVIPLAIAFLLVRAIVRGHRRRGSLPIQPVARPGTKPSKDDLRLGPESAE